jgi:hypothetical protein
MMCLKFATRRLANRCHPGFASQWLPNLRQRQFYSQWLENPANDFWLISPTFPLVGERLSMNQVG